MSIIPSTAITIDGTTAWLVVECPPDSAPANWEQADKQCDTCNGYPGPTQFEPRTCCDGTGRHTFTLHVEGERLSIANGMLRRYDGFAAPVHVVEVLPVMDRVIPAIVGFHIAKTNQGWMLVESDGLYTHLTAITLPADAAPDKYAVRLAVHA
jgi:hypothetical protein